MNCREFGSLTKTFVYGEITDNKIIQQYMAHAKECADCYDDLEVIYSMHRALGDIQGPGGDDDSSDYIEELKSIFSYYEQIALAEKTDAQVRLIVCVGIMLIGSAIALYILLSIFTF